MALNHSPKIVTNGLVFCVDPLNVKSYQGSGNSLIDMSSSAITGTLVGSPTYNSSNGSLSFNGTSYQYANCGSQLSLCAASDKTMCAWISPATTTNSPQGILDNDDSNSGWGFWIDSARKLWYWPYPVNDIKDTVACPLNQWTFATITYSFSTKTASFYRDGVFSSSGTHVNTELAPAAGTILLLGSLRKALFTVDSFCGSISIVSLYNRVLTNTEIMQNYNAHKGRFGK